MGGKNCPECSYTLYGPTSDYWGTCCPDCGWFSEYIILDNGDTTMITKDELYFLAKYLPNIYNDKSLDDQERIVLLNMLKKIQETTGMNIRVSIKE